MRSHQHGVAIVLAMGVVALAALTATALLVSQGTWSRQMELAAGHVQARLIMQAGLDWARAMLSDDRRVGNADHFGEPWALRLPPIPLDNGMLAGRIEDQQGKLNLNNMIRNGRIDRAWLAHLHRLLAILDLENSLADALAARIAANGRPMADAGELAQVRGFDDAVRARLRPYVTALPRFTAVNANTASAEVLAAVVEGLGLDGARALVAQRERAYFRDFGEFFRKLPSGLIVPTENISVSSEYFIATMRASIGGAQARGSALLWRESAAWPSVIWRRPT